MTTTSMTSSGDASAVALTTVFTPATTCSGLTFSAPTYSIWYNEPVPARNITESGCYPSQFLNGYTSLSTSSIAPALNPLVCPSGWTTALNSTSSYVACCPTGYAVHFPDSTVDHQRPAYGGLCFSGFTPTTLTVAEYNSTGFVQTQTVPFTGSGQVYAHIIDGWATRHALATSAVETNATDSASSSPVAMRASDHSLSGGAIAGLVIGCLVGAIALLALGFLFLRRRKLRQPGSGDDATETKADMHESGAAGIHESDGATAIMEKDGFPTALKHQDSARSPQELGSGSETAHEMESPPVIPPAVELESPLGLNWERQSAER